MPRTFPVPAAGPAPINGVRPEDPVPVVRCAPHDSQHAARLRQGNGHKRALAA
ncbi:MAG: hypothetical protein HY916_00235 [Desulfovibrio sp.]|jgi:hypothetical protein|nr:hypothetical protein [Desulfovibrio sp.]